MYSQYTTFVVFVNDKKLFHFSYERYLVNQLRKEFGLVGTPIRMIAREKIEKNEKIELRNIARGFAKEKEVALKKEDAKEVFEQLEKENEHVQESPSLSE